MTEKTEQSIQREQRRFDQSLLFLVVVGLAALAVELVFLFVDALEGWGQRWPLLWISPEDGLDVVGHWAALP